LSITSGREITGRGGGKEMERSREGFPPLLLPSLFLPIFE